MTQLRLVTSWTEEGTLGLLPVSAEEKRFRP